MLTNAEYHADREYLTSSGLKRILEDLPEFNRRWNLGIYPDEEKKAHFQDGSYTHSLLLEPHKIAEEYAFYEGLRKAGAAYQEFVSRHPGKEILSMPQKLRAESYAAAAKKLPVVLDLLNGCVSEQTFLGNISGIKVKVRTDAVHLEKRYIIDIKTTADPAGPECFVEAIKRWKYELSAALYKKVVEQNHPGTPFTYYWIVISKSDLICDVYEASQETLDSGLALVMQAITKYNRAVSTQNWESPAKPEQVISGYEIIKL